jgi:hypothetical protein
VSRTNHQGVAGELDRKLAGNAFLFSFAVLLHADLMDGRAAILPCPYDSLTS